MKIIIVLYQVIFSYLSEIKEKDHFNSVQANLGEEKNLTSEYSGNVGNSTLKKVNF